MTNEERVQILKEIRADYEDEEGFSLDERKRILDTLNYVIKNLNNPVDTSDLVYNAIVRKIESDNKDLKVSGNAIFQKTSYGAWRLIGYIHI